jgi:hypothetical protein
VKVKLITPTVKNYLPAFCRFLPLDGGFGGENAPVETFAFPEKNPDFEIEASPHRINHSSIVCPEMYFHCMPIRNSPKWPGSKNPSCTASAHTAMPAGH